MGPKKMILFVVGAAALALPAAASAQTYYGAQYGQRYYGQAYGQPGYGQPQGDYGRGYGRYGFGGYPQFRGIEAHIRQEIQEGARDDMLEPDDARDLMAQLRQIQMQEAREFRVHGWNLPDDDRERIRDRLAQLDQTVDQTRDEQ